MRKFEGLPGTTPLVAMALIDMAVSIVYKTKEKVLIGRNANIS